MSEENTERPLEPPGGTGHSLTDIQAVIESAKARGGMEALEKYIRRRLPEAEEAEVVEAAEVAVEIIDSIPIFLARARQEAAQRSLRSVVGPLLDHAERYFLQPVDLIPEMTQGLAGLLDDSYLLLRILENLDKGPEPFLDWDLQHPISFLRTLVGLEVSRKLDLIVADAMQQVSAHLNELWSRMSHQA
ncbi:MAG: hypothetical protein AMXMBFR53_42890 [Gemmatimonadota bacterium]